MEQHLGTHPWFTGPALSLADFQMSFAVEAALTRGATPGAYPQVRAWLERARARPAYQRAIEKGGPVVVELR